MNFMERLLLHARQTPTKTAYIYDGKEINYRELYENIQLFASGLRKLGFKKGDRIALFTWNNPYFLISYYGALYLGVVITPINPRYTTTEVERIIKHSGAKAIIAADSLLNKLHPVTNSLSTLLQIIHHPTERQVAFHPALNDYPLLSFKELMTSNEYVSEPINVAENDPAVMLYTSGTTGAPKGAILTYKNIYHGAKDHSSYLNITNEDRVLVTLPLNHVFGMTVTLNGPLYQGATLLLIEQFSPKQVFEVSKKHGATIFAGVPTMFSYLMQYQLSDEEKRASFRNLRFTLSGGASIPISLLHSFEETFHVPVLEGYGLTEAAPITFNRADGNRRKGSVGRAVPNIELKIVNSHGKTAKAGEKGELYVKGPVVMKEYYNAPKETELVFEHDWLRTGDVAEMDEEGYVYIVDRSKDVIIVKGYNVYPKEVEEVLYRHPSILEVSVVGKKVDECEEEVVAFVVLRKEHTLNEDELINFVKKSLTTYKCPTSIYFIDELPKNATGKIDKKSLREMLVGK